MIHPTLPQFPSRPTATHRSRPWRGALGLSLVVTGLGAVIGSTLSSSFGGLGWPWVDPLLTPSIALLAAVTVYANYRHLSLDWFQARMARVLVLTGGGMMLTAVALARPAMAGTALWFMTVATMIVTTLAAGAGASRQMDQAPVH